MRKLLAASLVFSLIYLFPVTHVARSEANAAALTPPQSPYPDSEYEPYTADQLDNLLAPIALYPDPLLAQVLLATTFPDQIQDAAQWLPTNNPSGIDYQNWDVSVKAVSHYPSVLSMLNDMLDWSTAVGQAYVYQSTDVMSSVQHLRSLAYSQGNLVSTPQQQVIVNGGYIQIDPAQPQVIYVPVYDPGVIYERRVYSPAGFGGFFSFGSGFAIGAWLNYDLDWGSRRVVYDGWGGGDVGWRRRSRPYVQINNVYVNNSYVNVNVNRTVVNRHVDYNNVNHFNSVHRDVNYDNRARFESNRGGNQPQPRGAGQLAPQPPNNNAPGYRTFSPGGRNQPATAQPNDRTFNPGARNQPSPANTQPAPQPNGRTFNPSGNNQPQGRPDQGRPAQGRQDQPAPTTPQQPNNRSLNPSGQNQPPPTQQNGRMFNRGERNQPSAPPTNAQPAPQPSGRTFNPSGNNQPQGRPDRPAPNAPTQPNNRSLNPGGRIQPPAGHPEQPPRPTPPVAPPPARPAPAPQPSPARTEPGRPSGQQQQQGQQGQTGQHGNRNDGKDNGKDNHR